MLWQALGQLNGHADAVMFRPKNSGYCFPMKVLSVSLLTVCGLTDLPSHKPRGITHVLSLLDPGWPEPEAFRDFGPHHRTTLRFHDVVEPRPDQVLPSDAHVREILGFGRALASDGRALGPGRLLVHCHMGISRSTAALLILLAQAHPHEDEEVLLEWLRGIRPQAWPNSRMIAFADGQLDRGGRLIQALGRHYAHQLAIEPSLAKPMREGGRGSEVAMGLRAAA